MPFKMKDCEFNNIKFYVGQSAKENWELLDIAKAENENFIWFHLNSFPSPYVIMWYSIDDLDDKSVNELLLYGANLCKEHSKYNFLKDIKIMYTTVKKLTKTETLGEVDIRGKTKIIKL